MTRQFNSKIEFGQGATTSVEVQKLKKIFNDVLVATAQNKPSMQITNAIADIAKALTGADVVLIYPNQYSQQSYSREDTTVEQRIISTIADQLGVVGKEVEEYVNNNPEASMEHITINTYDADSLDLVELVMSLEDEFDIEISDSEARGMMDKTIAQIATKIKERIG